MLKYNIKFHDFNMETFKKKKEQNIMNIVEKHKQKMCISLNNLPFKFVWEHLK